MKLQPRGLYGAIQRMRELQDRIDLVASMSNRDAVVQGTQQTPKNVPMPKPEFNFGEALKGAIPFNPMGAGVERTLARPSSGVLGMIQSAASKAGIDPALFEALVGRESSFNPQAVSISGAKGLSQLMPRTAEALGVTDIFDPSQNLNAGARYLAQLLRQYSGDKQMALAAYNAGPGTVDQVGGIPDESAGYVRDVLTRAAEIEAQSKGGQ
ncbi:MAG TPA: lytic transglycosylase domain-containing protein [Fimbriimonadaceae bacterium]|nr:lytic transglycosylase domain-containing protein [Fimbriimonadaceae bacterium]